MGERAVTALGKRTLERVRALAGELQKELLKTLTPEERRTLIILLVKLAGSAL